jgi:hypothetical protein
LSVNDDRVVFCNATVTDSNGYQDVFSLGSVNATLHHQSSSAGAGDDKNVHYTNTSCGYTGASGTSATAVCAFTLEHEALNGTWTCTVTAKDSLGSTASSTGTNTVDQLVAVEISESWIHFGVMGLGSSSSVANTTNVTNKGNVVIDLQVAGNADMSCLVGSLGVGNISYNLTGGAYATMSANKLSTSLSSALDFNLAPEGVSPFGEDQPATNLTYWTINVPSYGVRGECNNTVTIAGVISAG